MLFIIDIFVKKRKNYFKKKLKYFNSFLNYNNMTKSTSKDNKKLKSRVLNNSKLNKGKKITKLNKSDIKSKFYTLKNYSCNRFLSKKKYKQNIVILDVSHEKILNKKIIIKNILNNFSNHNFKIFIIDSFGDHSLRKLITPNNISLFIIPAVFILRNTRTDIWVCIFFLLIAASGCKYFDLKCLEPEKLNKIILICLFLLVALIIAGIATHILKILFGRWRPDTVIYTGLSGFSWFNFAHDAKSFPSGHSQLIWTVAVSLLLIYPRLIIIYLVR